jgi:alpha-1,2-mannosyltransferase
LVPDGIKVEFVKSEFDGALPGHFEEGKQEGKAFWWRDGTRRAPGGLNDLNRETPEFYVCPLKTASIATHP